MHINDEGLADKLSAELDVKILQNKQLEDICIKSKKETSLQNTLLSLEKTDISFRLMMQDRNKLLDAYQQMKT